MGRRLASADLACTTRGKRNRQGPAPPTAPILAGLCPRSRPALGVLDPTDRPVVLAKLLDARDLPILDQTRLGVVERHLAVGALYPSTEADVGHDSSSQLGQPAQLIVESVDRLEPVLEIPRNPRMASVRAGVWGVLDRLPYDLLGEEVEQSIKASDLGRAVRIGEDLADSALAPSLIRRESTPWFGVAHLVSRRAHPRS